jgi:hypothetical protein
VRVDGLRAEIEASDFPNKKQKGYPLNRYVRYLCCYCYCYCKWVSVLTLCCYSLLHRMAQYFTRAWQWILVCLFDTEISQEVEVSDCCCVRLTISQGPDVQCSFYRETEHLTTISKTYIEVRFRLLGVVFSRQYWKQRGHSSRTV